MMLEGKVKRSCACGVRISWVRRNHPVVERILFGRKGAQRGSRWVKESL